MGITFATPQDDLKASFLCLPTTWGDDAMGSSPRAGSRVSASPLLLSPPPPPHHNRHHVWEQAAEPTHSSQRVNNTRAASHHEMII